MANELEDGVEKLEKKLDEFIEATQRKVKNLEETLMASISLTSKGGE